MPLTGLEVYKLLPQTNCKECGFPTCLAFAMKLAAKQAELKGCPYVSEESKAKLEAASAPPIRLIQVGGAQHRLEVGSETVLFRHEKTFYHRPGLFLRLRDTEGTEAIKKKAAEADAFQVDYVGISLGLDGFAVEAAAFDALAELTQKLIAAGVEELVLDPMVHGYRGSLHALTHLRRLALRKNFRPLGYPILTFPGAGGGADEPLLAAEHITKYAGFIVLESFDPATLYPLLVLRQNIYTDPQKPIQVQPGLYEINSPNGDAPLMVTTNFSITYFAVANEVEGAGWPAWLVVTDAEGMSVLTAWAAGKFDAERIAKSIRGFGVAEKVGHQRLIIPGQVAVLSGELEEELPGWQIMVGPREAVDIGAFLKAMWPNGK